MLHNVIRIPTAAGTVYTSFQARSTDVEPSGASHPANVIDMLRSDNFSSVIDLRNTICLIDPSDFENERKRETAVFHDQIQVADIVIINWTDKRDRSVIDRCRHWIESFAPPKLMILESSFGEIDPLCLDVDASSLRSASFPNAHSQQVTILGEIPVLKSSHIGDGNSTPTNHAKPGVPLRLANHDKSIMRAAGYFMSMMYSNATEYSSC